MTNVVTKTQLVSAPTRRLGAGLVRLARPRQWPKNVLVLAAPVAAGHWPGTAAAVQVVEVLLLFVMASVSVYFINDCVDVDDDRRHSVKCRRPVAAGDVPLPLAATIGVLLAALSIALTAVLCNWRTTLLICVYIAVQIAYSFFLKKVVLLDLAIVSSGFLIRAMAGGVALGIPLSRWFLVTTAFGALFAIAAKRHSESVAQGRDVQTRDVIKRYTEGYLRFVWQLAAVVAVMSYGLWALDERPSMDTGLLPWRQLSMLPFVFAILRYAMFAERGVAEAPEEVVWHDRALAGFALAWAVLYGLALSGR